MKELLLCLVASLTFSCNSLLAAQPEENVTTVIFGQEVINPCYIGNGAQ